MDSRGQMCVFRAFVCSSSVPEFVCLTFFSFFFYSFVATKTCLKQGIMFSAYYKVCRKACVVYEFKQCSLVMAIIYLGVAPVVEASCSSVSEFVCFSARITSIIVRVYLCGF